MLLVNNAKAKVFKKYSVGFPYYSLLHTVEFETEDYKDDKLVVRNEINMVYMFPALRARPVLKSVVFKTVVYKIVVIKTEEYDTMEYETVVCDGMPMFPVKMVSLLHSSNPDPVMNELPAVAVEDKLMPLLCAVNMDFTDLETEPDALVDCSF